MSLRASLHRFDMAHPGDVSALAQALADGRVAAPDIVAVIGKTEGNGGVNDFTRGYFTQSLMALLSRHLDAPAETLLHRVPCVLSGGTEGVLTPHYLVLCRSTAADPSARPDDRSTSPAGGAPQAPGALAVGVAMSAPVLAEHIGRAAQIDDIAATVRQAMRDARIDDASQVCLVQVKVPAVTSASAQAARARGQTPRSSDPGHAMALSRAAGALGVALALGETQADTQTLETALLSDFGLCSTRASISSGVEVDRHEVIVLGHSPLWHGPLAMACEPMADALDLPAVVHVLRRLGLTPCPQLDAGDRQRVAGVLVKCEPDRRGQIRSARHTMLDDTDINAQRHIRGAVGALAAGVLGETRLFVSGGAEHQGPDGGGLIAVLVQTGPREDGIGPSSDRPPDRDRRTEG